MWWLLSSIPSQKNGCSVLYALGDLPGPPHTHSPTHTNAKKKKKKVRPLQMSARRLSAPALLLDYLAERKRQAEWGACPSSPGEMGAAEGHSLAE